MAGKTYQSPTATPGRRYPTVVSKFIPDCLDDHKVTAGTASRIVYSKARSKKVVDSERTVSA